VSASYFSDREIGERPRIKEEIDGTAWGGVVALVKSRILDASFGFRYPLPCRDNEGIFACDEDLFSQAVNGEISDISWPPETYYGSFSRVPSTLAILDLIEFCFRSIAQPIQRGYHSYFNHYHLSFDQDEGQLAFRQDVNRILARNGLTYELGTDGAVRRLAPQVLRQPLQTIIFQTGDTELDFMLETARGKFLSPDFAVRKEALEKLWDAWERLKTIEPPGKKPASAKILLDRAADEPTFRQLLDDESRTLTDAGNAFQIRHSEVSQVPLRVNEHVDYMFHRMFALVRLLLRTTGRGG
jgi:hypothetical protein